MAPQAADKFEIVSMTAAIGMATPQQAGQPMTHGLTVFLFIKITTAVLLFAFEAFER